jgi:hypothetical protein
MLVPQSAVRSQRFDERAGQQPEAQASLLDVEFSDGETHARTLQKSLADAFTPISETKKFPLGTRLRIIVGLTSALWLAIGLAVALLM